MTYTTPVAGFTEVVPGAARSGTASKTKTFLNTSFSRVDFQVLTDQNWSTYTDGRQIIFNLAFSFDGGTTFPWTDGPWTAAPPARGKNGLGPFFGGSIPPGINAYQASYSVVDANGVAGPTIDFGIADQLS